ncbi:hypothetical protein ACCO45_004206 [Purpureocillium lilacinum]|uniref:Uncharacterized protein n=1 Tax=Purpureocillium lilacinum TaxID=33203 RepID=A0ACC4E2X6_PURLI
MSSRSRSSSASSPSSRRSRSVVGFFPKRMTFYAKESSGNWFSRYKEIQPHQWRSVAVRIMAYATGAPPNATVVKKKSRVQPETLEPMDGLAEFHSRLFWITVYDNGEAMPAEMVEDIPRQNMHYEEQGAYASAPAGDMFSSWEPGRGLQMTMGIREAASMRGQINRQYQSLLSARPIPRANSREPGVEKRSWELRGMSWT